LFGYTNLNTFVYDAVLNFWTWVQIPPSPPYFYILRTIRTEAYIYASVEVGQVLIYIKRLI